ncbi:homogentisate 1,2-dioxygenase [Aliiglaciecola lipolytica]|uniref:Homogentisate 1,2-dioxygenase n=1 Tax=Aliiglaciecola lipolytica E3 TaxID=1127673 RepID=K6Y781_9ALTE|nr:homogentisate 1,2-dioxygenase [Aliiglaciecola lipolytica]GAC14082.1 homogentisate 1,2-dioxygenase [Aliiglaciecola lipolytica E3]
MRKWIQFPRQQGTSSRQAHADFPEQAIFEREIGRSGFFGPATHLHHTHAPTGWSDWQGPLRPRAFDLNLLPEKNISIDGNSPWSAAEILFNSHCRYRMWHCVTAMQKLARNADGDELLFIHQGGGQLFCDYGHLTLKQGDYVVIPRSTMWRIEPDSAMQILMIEATNDSYQLPEKGLVGPHAIFDSGMLDTPTINDEFKAQYSEQMWQVEIKRHNQISQVTYPFNPLDAIGWHGDLSVVRINWRDIRPLMSHRYHLPPSAHTTFVASRFVICTFVPRPIESDPGALKVPFYHNNDDYDEVLFYHEGDFFSRDNIEKGMVTFHPAGFTHGPHPKAFAAGRAHKKTFTDEVAVMLDTRDALTVSDVSSLVENADYVNSWKEK